MNQLALPGALTDDLAQVDAAIRARLAPRAAVFQVAGHHIIAPNDNRIHAVMTLLCAQLGRYDLAMVLHSAAAVELIHAAALVHDGLIDEAERRHGQATPERWNGDVALMVGDYLFALAAAEMALAPDPRIITYFSQAVMANSEAGLAPVLTLTPLATARAQYLDKISGTAALFEAACKAGAVCGGLAQTHVDALGRFGLAVGLAFQIVDDVRAYGAVEASDGKLRSGTITLPLIYVVDANPNPALIACIEAAQLDDQQVAWVVGEVQRTGAGQRALDDAQQYVEQALHELDFFSDTPSRRLLVRITRSITDATLR